jgi:hypothetical protein
MNEKKEHYSNKENKVICLFLPTLISIDKLNDLVKKNKTDINIFYPLKQEKSEIAKKKLASKLILSNCFDNEKQLDEQIEELEKIGRRITDIILFKPANFNLIEEFRKKYLICPYCKKVYLRIINSEKDLKENLFICPNDNKKSTLKKIEELFDVDLKNFFKNSENLIKKILTKQDESSSIKIRQLVIERSEEIFSEEACKKL